jgi:hypothetical protein
MEKVKIMKKNQQLIKKDEAVRPLVLDRAESIKAITNNAGYGIASKLLSEIKLSQKKVKNEKDKVLIPLNAAIKAERARWSPIEKALEEAEYSLKGKMTDFIDAQEEKKKKIEADQRITKTETLVRKTEEFQAPVAAEVSIRKIKVLNIHDKSLIPVEYLDPNTVKITAALKSGQEVPGCRLVEQTSLAAY